MYRRLLGAGVAVLSVHLLPAQEKPLNLTGTLSTGFYSTQSRSPVPVRLNFIPFSTSLDLNGYLFHPGFISYQVQPQFTVGPQATEAGFVGGNGGNASLTFLRDRDFPLTLKYGNLEREDVFYGSLTQLSGFRSINHDRSLGLSWQWRNRNLPQFTFDLSHSRLTADPDVSLVPDFNSRARQYRLGMDDQRWGWTFQAHARRERIRSDFVNPLDTLSGPLRFNQYISDYQASALRPLWRGAQYSITGGVTENHNSFNGRPFNQDITFGTTSLSFGEQSRLRGGVRAGYSTNLLGSEIQRALGGLGGGQPGVLAPETILFLPLKARISTLSLRGHLRYSLWKDLAIFAQAGGDHIRTPETAVSRSSDYLTGTGGLNYQHSFSWAHLMGQYSRTLGRLTYANIPGRLRGENLSLSGQRGSLADVEITVSYNRSRQVTDQTTQFRSGNQAGDLTLGHRFDLFGLGLALRAGGGLDSSYFRDGTVDFHARGLTWHGGLDHRLIQASYSHMGSRGNTLQAFLLDSANSSLESALLLGIPLRSLLSRNRGDSLTVHVSPFRRADLSLSWTRGRQLFDARLMNDYEQLDMRAGYRFRLLSFEAGYIRYEQVFATLSPFLRSRVYVRVSRQFGVF